MNPSEKKFLKQLQKDKEDTELKTDIQAYIIDDGRLSLLDIIETINEITKDYDKQEKTYLVNIYSDRYTQRDIYSTKKLNTNVNGILTINTINSFTLTGDMVKKDYYFKNEIVFYEE